MTKTTRGHGSITGLFTEHPATAGQTYFQHLCFAGGFGTQMVIGGIAGIIHALLPFLFERTCSNVLFNLHENLTNCPNCPEEKRK